MWVEAVRQTTDTTAPRPCTLYKSCTDEIVLLTVPFPYVLGGKNEKLMKQVTTGTKTKNTEVLTPEVL